MLAGPPGCPHLAPATEPMTTAGGKGQPCSHHG